MRSFLAVSALASLRLSSASASADCTTRCINSGACCTGNVSGWQHPSCQMGCVIGAQSASVADCNATCLSASGCSLVFKGTTFQLCSTCANRWVDPSTMLPAILPAGEPYWPPGYATSSCNSADSVQCQLGCMMAFDPSLAPLPPNPPPPPALPLPPAPWPNPAPGFNFSEAFSDHVVLQQGPGAASVFGNTGALDDAASVLVTVTPSSGAPYSVPAAVQGGRWRAILKPAASFDQTGVTYTITAACSAGCGGGAPVSLTDVVYGDVFFCGGQSNMWLQLRFTYAHNSSRAAVLAGTYGNVRLMSGDSQTQGLSGGVPPVHPWRWAKDAAGLDADSNPDAWSQFSAPCWHFAEALTDQIRAAGKAPPTIGLVAMAIGGSTIEEWMTNDVAETCSYFQHNANGGELNHVLWDTMVRTFVNMTVKGWLFYQGENNAGSLHGNYATQSGYACMMPALIASWRAAWSATPGTTDPMAPFGICTLSADDSEGAASMGSFRFAQAGSFGVAPNAAMPNTYIAHGYDLADPYVYCGDAPQTKQCPGCDAAADGFNCLQPWYMGPGIHPRLKKPFGQRLAASFLVGVYGKQYGFGGPVTGPTIQGCSWSSAANVLYVYFNHTLQAGGALIVNPWDLAQPKQSGMSILVNSTDDAGSGTWLAVNYERFSSSIISIDMSQLGGAAPQAIKYAWGATGGRPNEADVICCQSMGAASECVPGQCPIFVAQPLAPYGGHPANPFLAKIVPAEGGGSCLCPSPQLCSTTTADV